MGVRLVPFRPERSATLDTARWARKRPTIPVLLEVDVTRARERLRAARTSGRGPGFTAWVVSCVARAAAEHPRVHALRSGRRHIALSDHVDVAVAIERALAGDELETVPMPVVVRRADTKSARDIQEEVRSAQAAPVPTGAVSIGHGTRAGLQSAFFRFCRGGCGISWSGGGSLATPSVSSG